MPAAYAHAVITDRALGQYRDAPGVDPPFKAAALRASHFTRLGCISPDYPYLDLLQFGQASWADHMHYDHTGDLVQTMARRLMELKGQGMERPEFAIPFAWTLGYISHVTADLVVHPVVRSIVGDYASNKDEHRHCEMIQDVYIYHRVRGGAEIRQSYLLETLTSCSNPADPNRIHPILAGFWGEAFRQHFVSEYATNPPDIDRWHISYREFLGAAGRPLFLGRLDPAHKFTYKLTTEITPDERQRFLEALPLPGGRSGTYDALFDKAVGDVLSQWVALTRGLGSGSLGPFLAGTPNCNLDTGEVGASPQLRYWA